MGDVYEIRDLAERVDRLERENRALRRRLRRFALATTALAAVAIGGAAALQNVGKFQKAVEVSDAQGQLRSVLFADDDNDKSGLEIRDPQGKARLSVHTNQNDDPFIAFVDKNGKNRLELGIGVNGSAYLVINRGDGTNVHNFVAE